MMQLLHPSLKSSRFLAAVALATLGLSLLTSCGRPTTLYAARDKLSAHERDLVSELTHAAPEDAASLREYLAARAAPAFEDDVRAGKLTRGLPACELLRSWGEPDDAHRGWFYDFESWTYNLSGDASYPLVITFDRDDQVLDFGGNLTSWGTINSDKKPPNNPFLISPNARPRTPTSN